MNSSNEMFVEERRGDRGREERERERKRVKIESFGSGRRRRVTSMSDMLGNGSSS